MNHIIETFELSKSFISKDKKKIDAVKKFNLQIKEGEIFGLLGPNGAGKTTFISLLSTLLSPTSGYAIIDGNHLLTDVYQIRKKIGLMLESSLIYYRMTGFQNLKFFAKIYDIPNYQEKIQELSQFFGLEEYINTWVDQYSTGMKMKLALARVLLLDPRILILDEPTLGLDVRFIDEFVKYILKVKKTIILTSHNLDLVQKVCNRVAIINKGEILKIDFPNRLRNLTDSGIRISLTLKEMNKQILEKIRSLPNISQVNSKNKNISLVLSDRNHYSSFLRSISELPILKIYEKKVNIEDFLLEYY